MRTGAIVIVVAVTLGMIALGIVAATTQPPAPQPPAITMAENGQAMQRAGALMQTHGQEMLDAGQRAADQTLMDHGKHWVTDGQALIRGGQIAANPAVPVTEQPGASAGLSLANAVTLTNAAQQMLNDAAQGRAVDTETLRWNGMAMQSEGRTMTEHARVMDEEIDLMIARYGMNPQTATDLRGASQTLRDTGNRLTANGQTMIDYANRLRQSLGYR